MSDAGQIVGYYDDANDVLHGYLATPTPVPEPRTLPIMAGCLVALRWLFGRNQQWGAGNRVRLPDSAGVGTPPTTRWNKALPG
jgi:hypothetical protein